MKVAIAVDALSPQLSGIGRYTWELATRLPKQNVESVSYYHQGSWVLDPAQLLIAAKDNRLKPKKYFGLKLPKWYKNFRLKHECKNKVFHGPNFFLPPCVSSGVITVHDLSVFKFAETHPIERIKHFEREFKYSIARASHIITDSLATRLEVNDFLAWPANKVSAVPLGVAPHFHQEQVTS